MQEFITAERETFADDGVKKIESLVAHLVGKKANRIRVGFENCRSPDNVWRDKILLVARYSDTSG